MIFDAHLDLAVNVVRGRNVTQPAVEQPVLDGAIATVGLPDLRAGGVEEICATVFCPPARPGRAGYSTREEAFADANRQIEIYNKLHDSGQIALVHRTPTAHNTEATDRPSAEKATTPTTARSARQMCQTTDDPLPRVHLLVEGADCFRGVEDVAHFQNAGVRTVGLAWQRTHYAGGTGSPGPITPAGQSLVAALDDAGMIHDASHLAEQSLYDLFDLARGKIIASHSNCRAIIGDDPGERHLSDEAIRKLVERGGVIGINLYDKFLLPVSEYGRRRADVDDVVRHVRHICDLVGGADNVGIGSDMDGGLGREQIPQQITTSRDLSLVADALLAAGFARDDVNKIMFKNWQRIFN